MLREAPRQLLPLVAASRSFTTSQAAASFAPAIANKPSGGLFSFITGGARVNVPLDQPLELISDVKPAAPPATRPALAVSEHHGVKVAAQDSVGPMASVALYVNAGSAYETPGTTGASKYLEYMGFKTTANRTTFRLTRELEKMGASATVQAGREATGFQITASKLALPEAVEVLLDSVCNAKLNGWEIEDMLAKVQDDAAHALATPEVLVSEIMHRCAYEGGLGQALISDPAIIGALTIEAIQEFYAAHVTPSSFVLAGSGLSAGTLEHLAGPLLSPSPAAAPAAPASQYVGGSLNCIAPAGATFVGLAFEAKGGLSDAKAVAAAAVVKALLEAEARPVLPYVGKRLETVRSLTPITSMYRASGLVGLIASCEPSAAGRAVDALSARFEALAKGVSEPGLAVAKAVATSAYRSKLGSNAGAVEDFGKQLLARGKVDNFGDVIAGLSAADVNAFVKQMLKSAPTLVSYGSLSYLPRYDAVAKRLS